MTTPQPTAQAPTAQELGVHASAIMRDLRTAKAALERCVQRLRAIEDANEPVPFEQTRWIGSAQSETIVRRADLCADLATSVRRMAQ